MFESEVSVVTVEVSPTGLARRIRQARDAVDMGQRLFGESFGKGSEVAQKQISRWEKGEAEPAATELLHICRITGADPNWLLLGVGQEPRPATESSDSNALSLRVDLQSLHFVTRLVPQLGVSHQARKVEPISPADLDKIKLAPERIALFRATDDEMSDTFFEGDDLIVDVGDTERRSGVWLIDVGDRLIARRVRWPNDGSCEIINDNKRYPDRPPLRKSEAERVHIVGRIVQTKQLKKVT